MIVKSAALLKQQPTQKSRLSDRVLATCLCDWKKIHSASPSLFFVANVKGARNDLEWTKLSLRCEGSFPTNFTQFRNGL